MKKILAVFTIILFTVSLALAVNDTLSKPDKNNDGKISRQEYLDTVNKTFDQLDKNRDGVLTRDEVQSNDKIDALQFMKEADANHDGRVLKKEYEQAASKRFLKLDKNRSGFIDKNEWSAGRSELYSPFTLFMF